MSIDNGIPEGAASAIRRTLVVPVYKNELNIPALVEALNELAVACDGLEVILVIDGSPDKSGELLLGLRPTFKFSSQIIFHSRNFGSFAAIRTGLEFSSGMFTAVMAADLQEPPELVLEFFRVLESGEADVAFGQRIDRHDSWLRDRFSDTFWWLYRKLVIADVPKGGVDIFACGPSVREAVLEISEPNSSLIAQLFWVGFRRKFVPYKRRKRELGQSAWSFSRRMRYMMDSIFSFSDFPILLVMWFGIAGCILSLAFGVGVAIGRLLGYIEQPGYAALVVLITFSASAMLAVQGILGSYLWRTFENSKKRPLRIISKIERQP